MRVFLVRHGESKANVDPTVHRTVADHAIELSERGHEQAAAAGKFLSNYIKFLPGVTEPAPDRDVMRTRYPEPRLWVSTYTRTRQTADEIEKATQGQLRDRREHVLLVEQQFGLFDGLSDDELKEQYPAEQAHYQKCQDFGGRFYARMPLGESRFDVAQRVHQAFGTFHRDADRHSIDNIIVVAHGTTLRAFAMMWLHLSPEWFEKEPNPKNCSIRLIEDGKDGGYIYAGG